MPEILFFAKEPMVLNSSIKALRKAFPLVVPCSLKALVKLAKPPFSTDLPTLKVKILPRAATKVFNISLFPEIPSIKLLIVVNKLVNKSTTNLITSELAKFIVNAFHAFDNLFNLDSKLSVVFSNCF